MYPRPLFKTVAGSRMEGRVERETINRKALDRNTRAK